MLDQTLEGFFHPQVNISQPTESELFTPSYKKGKAGLYTAIIRFIPNISDPVNKSVIKKNVAFLKNPLTNQGMYVDCPSTVGKPDPIVNTFFKLRNSASPQDKENSKNFSRSQRFYSLIQVLQCAADPSLNGKFLIWNYGVSVYNKVYAELNPSNEYGVSTSSKNPFDLLVGRPFFVSCKEKGGFSNFDDSHFIDVQPDTAANYAIKINVKNNKGEETPVLITDQLVQNPQGAELVVKYFKEKLPNLNKYEYKEWDEETQNFVASVINYYCGNNSQNGVYQSTASQQQNNAAQQHTAPESTPLNINDVLTQHTEPQQHVEPQQAAPVAPSTIPDLNDVLSSNSGVSTASQAAPESSDTPLSGLDLDDILNNNF